MNEWKEAQIIHDQKYPLKRKSNVDAWAGMVAHALLKCSLQMWHDQHEFVHGANKTQQQQRQ